MIFGLLFLYGIIMVYVIYINHFIDYCFIDYCCGWSLLLSGVIVSTAVETVSVSGLIKFI